MKTIIIYIISVLFVIIASPAFSQYNEQEKHDLLVTLEEEKVAFDFYSEMYKKYNSKVFGNIVESEKTHREHVLTMLNDLNIDVSEYNTPTGQFQDKEMQDMYNMLTEMGSYSLEDALRASAKYEENDINELRVYRARADNQSIKDLYSCLELATGNHLRAFVKNLKSEGINYKPKVLSEEDYKTIISSENQSGNCFQNK